MEENNVANEEKVEGTHDQTEAPVNASAGADDTAYAYVRNGDSLENGAVIRIAEDQLATYLLDPIEVVTYDRDGNKVGKAHVSASWPFAFKIDDKSAEAVRLYRASLEKEGNVFQFTEVSKADWDKANA